MTAKYEAAMIFSVANGEEATLGLKEKFNDLIAKTVPLKMLMIGASAAWLISLTTKQRVTMFSLISKAKQPSPQN